MNQLHGCVLQVFVMKIASGKVGLTQKTEEERQAEESMAKSGVGAGFKKKATNTLEAALAQAGFKSSPKPKVSHVMRSIPLLAGHQPCIVRTLTLLEVLVKMPTNTLQAALALLFHLSDSQTQSVPLFRSGVIGSEVSRAEVV